MPRSTPAPPPLPLPHDPPHPPQPRPPPHEPRDDLLGRPPDLRLPDPSDCHREECRIAHPLGPLEREVIVAGNYDHLELWNPTTWEKHLTAVEGSVEHAAERLAAHGS